MKKTIVLFMVIIMVMGMTGCGNTANNQNNESVQQIVGEPISVEDIVESLPDVQSDVAGEQADASVTEESISNDGGYNLDENFDESLFEGKIRDCFYGNEHELFILADYLYLYNNADNSIIAQMDINANDIAIKNFDDGYAVVVNKENGLEIIMCNKELVVQEEIQLRNLVAEDHFMFVSAVDVDSTGNKVVFSGLQGMYLHNRENGSVIQLIDGLNEYDGYKSINCEYAAFIEDSDKIIFKGTAIPVAGNNGVTVYGTIGADGANTVIHSKSGYKVDELLAQGDTVVLPQEFRNADGTLLAYNPNDGSESMINFSSAEEGKDGVYISNSGNYVATAILGENMIIVRIYSVDTKELVSEQEITDDNGLYFNRIPQVLMFDESKSCMVLLGKSISEVETKIEVFNY